jgi:drug/metabolite transporter (DMT)-like permease
MNKAVFLLRLSYWIAAIADFAVAVLVWMPERMGVSEVVYPMGLASAIAFSWGVILVMADREPLERRWILIPTILVVALIAAVRTVFSIDGSIEFSLVLLVFPVVLIIFMMYSCYKAGKYVANL